MKINKDMVGCRVLYTLNEDMMNYPFSGEPREGIIQELSPDGNYAKILHIIPYSGEEWHMVGDVEIISILERPGEEVKKEKYL